MNTERCPGPAGRRARPAARPGCAPTNARATMRARQAASHCCARFTGRSGLPLAPLNLSDGWVDDPADPRYNTLVALPYPASHEELWRADGLYDLIVVIGYNMDPVVPGKGSAIFLHVVRPDYGGTAGCIAIAREVL